MYTNNNTENRERGQEMRGFGGPSRRPFVFMSPVLSSGYIDLYIETYRTTTTTSDNNNNSGGESSRAAVVAQQDAAWVTEGLALISLIAEPMSRTTRLQHFRITPFSLGAVVDAPSDCFPADDTDTTTIAPPTTLANKICNFLKSCTHNWDALTTTASSTSSTSNIHGCGNPHNTSSSSVTSEAALRAYISACVERYKVVSVVLATDGRCYLESTSLPVLRDELLQDRGLQSQVRGGCLEMAGSTPTLSIKKHVVTSLSTSPSTTAQQLSSSSSLATATPTATTSDSVVTWRVELLDTASAPVVRERCLRLGYPAFQDYVFGNDEVSDSKDGVRSIDLHLRPQCAPRPYQYAAVASVVVSSSLTSSHNSNNNNHNNNNNNINQHQPLLTNPNTSSGAGGEQRCRSGIIVLPCGAGKTLVGVMCAAAVRKRTLIVCAGSVSVTQWKNQLLEFASLGATPNASTTGGGGGAPSSSVRYGANPNVQRIACVTGKQKDPIDPLVTDVVITTYNMLSVARKLLNKLEINMLEGTGGDDVGDDDDDDDDDPTINTSTMKKRRSNLSLEELLHYHGPRLSRHAKTKLEFFRPFGLVLLDEVHVVPADYFKESLSCLRARALVGLTATFVREDNRIGDLFHIVGPKLFDVPWQELSKQRYLAKVMCVEVHVGMTPEFGMEYLSKQAVIIYRSSGGSAGTTTTNTRTKRTNSTTSNNNTKRGGTNSTDDTPPTSSPLLVSMAASNPFKVMAVLELVAAHRDDKVLVFCDHLDLLRLYSRLLQCPMVCGETSHKDRLMVFSDFQAAGGNLGGIGGGCGSVICISRVGDVSVNLPSASVVIQVSSHGGSRRQEGQRLGRILRPKAAVGNNNGGAGNGGMWIRKPTETICLDGSDDNIKTQQHKQEATTTTSSSPAANSTSTSSIKGEGQQQQSSNNDDGTTSREWITSLLLRAEAEGAQALFYSLVSNDTVEVPYAARRAQFLVDCGFPFHSTRYPPPLAGPPPSVLRRCGLTAAEASAMKSDNNGLLSGMATGQFPQPPRVKSEMGLSVAATRATAVRKKGESNLAPPTRVELEREIRGVWTRSWQVGLLGRVVSHWEDIFNITTNGGSAGVGVPTSSSAGGSGGGFVWSVAPILEEANNRIKQQQQDDDDAEEEEGASPLSRTNRAAGMKRERSSNNNQHPLVEMPQPPPRRGGGVQGAPTAATTSPFGFDDRLVYHEF